MRDIFLSLGVVIVVSIIMFLILPWIIPFAFRFLDLFAAYPEWVFSITGR